MVHVLAGDLGSAAFGDGYALAQDRGCDLADQIVKVRSERARWFGRGVDDRHVNSDFAYLHLGLYERAETQWLRTEGDLRSVLEGYVAGYNAYLAEAGAFDGWCADADWVSPITPVDLLAYQRDLVLNASSRRLVEFVATAQPPGAAAREDGAGPDDMTSTVTVDAGSNGWAIGADLAEANGLLFANPHFPWEGELRFWEHHITVPGELNVYGASPVGVMAIQIGFNEHIAWTETVSAGKRFTAYLLTLPDTDPTSYVFGDEIRSMSPSTYEIDVLSEDGSLGSDTRTLWATHYGPVIDLPGIGWTADRAVTYRDANLDNDEVFDHYAGLMRATGMDDFQAVHAQVNSRPFSNTLAVSDDGRVWYADTSATPNLSDQALDAWRESIEADPVVAAAFDNGLVLLDGSDPVNEWVPVEGAREPGLIPFDQQPQLERRDFVFNANDSYWMVNPAAPLVGYSPLHGGERQALSPRSRMNAIAIAEGGGSDGKFSLDDVLGAFHAERVLTAELLLEGVLADVCPSASQDAARACNVLEEWDRTARIDSRGTAVWLLFMEAYDQSAFYDAGPLFATGFDPADPIGTPRDPAFAEPTNREIALEALAGAVEQLDAGSFPANVAWGELQTAARGDQLIPIPGASGSSQLGTINLTGFGTQPHTTLEPRAERGTPVLGDSTLTDLGLRVNWGTSFLLVVEYQTDGTPRARARLVYGQSSDPSDPRFWEQTLEFSMNNWRDVRFTEQDITADPSIEILEVSQ